MAVSLAETLTIWSEAIAVFEKGDARQALALFKQCQDQSAIMMFNIGVCHLKLKSYRDTIASFDAALKKDQHLAIAYFQRGVSNHFLGSDGEAARDFDEAHRRMRGTRVIDYRQLGLPCKLFECDVLLNAALVCARLGQSSQAQDRLSDARDAQLEKRHEQLCRDFSSAIRERGSGGSIVMLPGSSLFRPAKQKLSNIKKQNFLGDAKVLSSVIDQDQFSGFMGKKELEDGGSSPAVSRPSRSPTPSPRALSPLSSRTKDSRYRALYDFEPSTNQEVALSEGDLVKVKKKDGDGWFTITNITTGQSGLVPASYLEEVPGSPAGSSNRSHSEQERFRFPGFGGRKASTGEESPIAARKSDVRAPPVKALPTPSLKPPTLIKPPSIASKPTAIKASKSMGSVMTTGSKPPVSSKPMSPPGKKSDKQVTIKLHMDHTRVLQMSPKTSLSDLLSAVCRKFQQEENSLSLWYKVDGELTQVEGPEDLNECWRQAEANRQHLTLWVYGSS